MLFVQSYGESSRSTIYGPSDNEGLLEEFQWTQKSFKALSGLAPDYINNLSFNRLPVSSVDSSMDRALDCVA